MSTEVDFIENMAQSQIKYETIFQKEQNEVLGADVLQFEAAMSQLQLVAKPGRHWHPAQDDVDEYLTRCDEIRHLVPQDFYDRVKILHAAHGALMCLTTCKIAQQHDRVQLAILKRHHELAQSMDSAPIKPEGTHEAPLSKPRQITSEELRLFQNPDNLHGQRFVLSDDNDDSGIYEVIGYSRKRDKSVDYDLLFDDCVDPIMVDTKEMVSMLEDSLYLPA